MTFSDVIKPLPLNELRKLAKTVVIDDDPTAFAPFRVLQGEGYSIEYWDDVKSLERLEDGDYDVIVLDIVDVGKRFSSGEGFSILEHLKKYNPRQVIIAYSNKTFDLTKNRFWKMVDDVLPKPAEPMHCKEVIDQLLPETLTVEHCWQRTEALLKASGAGDKAISKLQRQVINALRSRNGGKVLALVESVAKPLDVWSRVGIIVLRILALCGITGA